MVHKPNPVVVRDWDFANPDEDIRTIVKGEPGVLLRARNVPLDEDIWSP